MEGDTYRVLKVFSGEVEDVIAEGLEKQKALDLAKERNSGNDFWNDYVIEREEVA